MTGREHAFWKQYNARRLREGRRHRLNMLKRRKRGQLAENAW